MKCQLSHNRDFRLVNYTTLAFSQIDVPGQENHTPHIIQRCITRSIDLHLRSWCSFRAGGPERATAQSYAFPSQCPSIYSAGSISSLRCSKCIRPQWRQFRKTDVAVQAPISNPCQGCSSNSWIQIDVSNIFPASPKYVPIA
jgi:hypothetical protein